MSPPAPWPTAVSSAKAAARSWFSGALIAAFGGLVDSKVNYLLLHLDELKNTPGSAFDGAGLVWYGGFIGAAAGGLLFITIKKLPWAVEFPQGAIPTPPGVSVQPTQLSLILAGVTALLWFFAAGLRSPGCRSGRLIPCCCQARRLDRPLEASFSLA